jgi:hypothetical protein
MIRLAVSFFLIFFAVFSLPQPTDARSGCCSHHGGIDHCDSSTGSYVCRDKTYSPTCGCYQAPESALPTYGEKSMKEFLDTFDPQPTIIPTPTFLFVPISSEQKSQLEAGNLPKILFWGYIILVAVIFLIRKLNQLLMKD